MDKAKLYKVTLRGLHSSSFMNYNASYVVAEDSRRAYRKVRAYLDKEGLGFERQRELKKIELVADADKYGSCGTLLFL